MSFQQPTSESVIPIVDEALRVERTVVETGAVRVRVRTALRTEVIDEPVLRRGVTVDRIERKAFVDERREPWSEGEVLVVPVYEEVMVKRMLLVEELRLTPTLSVHHQAQSLELKSETAVFERQRPDGTWQEVSLTEFQTPSEN